MNNPEFLFSLFKVRRFGAREEEGLRAEAEDAADRVEEGVEAQDEALQEAIQEELPIALRRSGSSKDPDRFWDPIPQDIIHFPFLLYITTFHFLPNRQRRETAGL